MTEKPAYICSHIFEDTKPILYVCKEGGDWQFLCGGDHDDSEIPKVVGINHLLDRDKSLSDLLDLENDWEAIRINETAPWVRRRIVD